MGVQGFARVCMGVQGFTRVYKGVQGYTRVCRPSLVSIIMGYLDDYMVGRL